MHRWLCIDLSYVLVSFSEVNGSVHWLSRLRCWDQFKWDGLNKLPVKVVFYHDNVLHQFIAFVQLYVKVKWCQNT